MKKNVIISSLILNSNCSYWKEQKKCLEGLREEKRLIKIVYKSKIFFDKSKFLNIVEYQIIHLQKNKKLYQLYIKTLGLKILILILNHGSGKVKKDLTI